MELSRLRAESAGLEMEVEILTETAPSILGYQSPTQFLDDWLSS